jgi:hypothetical protein
MAGTQFAVILTGSKEEYMPQNVILPVDGGLVFTRFPESILTGEEMYAVPAFNKALLCKPKECSLNQD